MLNSVAIKIGAAVAIIALLIGYGYFKGKSASETRQLKDTVKAHETGKAIKTIVDQLGPYDLCIALDGLPDDCAQLRGVGQSAEGK